MNPKKLYIFYSYCISLLFFACQYDQTEEVFTEIETPEPSNTSIQINLDQDTIELVGNALLSYRYSSDNEPINLVTFDIDNINIYSKQFNRRVAQSEFSLNNSELTMGYHNLTMTVYVKTGSGSLADKVDAEAFIYSKTWVLKYYKDPPKPIISFAGEENGTMMVKWDTCKLIGFENYKVQRGIYNIYLEDFIFSTFDPIEENTHAWYNDKSFLGGGVKYIVTLCAGGKETISDTISLNFPNVGFNLETNQKLQRVFSWNKPIFYNNMNYINVIQSDNYIFNGEKIATISDPEDTVFIMPDGIYPDMNYRLIMNSDYLNQDYDTDLRLYKDFNFNIETDTFLLENYLYNNGGNPSYIYGKQNNKLTRYNVQSDSYTNLNIDYDFIGVSPDNNYLVCNGILVDPVTFEQFNLDLKQTFDLFFGVGSYYISTDGVLVASNRYRDMIVYDLKNKRPIQEITSIYQIFSPVLSPNGEYIVLRGDYYPRIEIWKRNIENGLYEEVSYFHGDYKDSKVVFEQSQDYSHFYIVNNGEVEYWSCEDETIEYTFPTEGKTAICIDAANGNLVTYADEILYIYDVNTHKKIREVGYYADSYYKNEILPKKFILLDDVIYVDNKQLDLKNYDTLN